MTDVQVYPAKNQPAFVNSSIPKGGQLQTLNPIHLHSETDLDTVRTLRKQEDSEHDIFMVTIALPIGLSVSETN